MIDHKNILRFLSKPDIQLSIEEYLFLITCRFRTEEKLRQDFDEVTAYADLYYAQNVFYGQEVFDKEKIKRINWNLLIRKLVKQGYLIDFRTEEEITSILEVDWKKLQVTELFKTKIWTNDIDSKWEDVENLVFDKCGKLLQLPNGNSQFYFSISNADFVNNLEELKKYWWVEICKSGNMAEIEKFRHHLEHYLDKYGLNMKFVTFISNYTKGILKKMIEEELEEEMYSPDINSRFKRR